MRTVSSTHMAAISRIFQGLQPRERVAVGLAIGAIGTISARDEKSTTKCSRCSVSTIGSICTVYTVHTYGSVGTWIISNTTNTAYHR